MTRRNFLKTTGAGAVALAAPKPSLFAADEDKPLRVAIIGFGWYGKTDLFHLIQVAPVEVRRLVRRGQPRPRPRLSLTVDAPDAGDSFDAPLTRRFRVHI